MNDKTEMYRLFGIAAIILAVCLGMGSCQLLLEFGKAEKVRAEHQGKP